MSDRTLSTRTMVKTNNWYTIWSMTQSNSFPHKLDAPGERAFFIFLTFVLVGMYIWSVISTPILHEPLQLILFTVLMLVHLALHWSIFIFYNHLTWYLPYIIGQGLLLFCVTLLAGNIGIILGLYMALIGESIGLMRGQKLRTALAVGYCLLLSMISYGLLFGWGNLLWWALASLPMVLFVGIYVTLYSRQAEARERAQALAKELEKANRQLSEYAARVEDLTIINERQRMARELHDTLSQGLAGLILQLEAVDAHLVSGRHEKAQSIVKQTMLQARSTLSDARRAIDDLRQNHFGDLGDSLRLEISRFETATGIPCHFQADLTSPLPDPVQEVVTRAVAESLTNIARHARASHASLNITVNETHLTLTIQDDGIGFDPTNIPSGHYGLLGMRERIRLIGGDFSIESASQKGTILNIEIPLDPDAKVS